MVKTIQTNKNCCGYPLLCDENETEFNKNAKEIINSIPQDTKYIVCSCTTCYETLKNIEQIKDKLITIEDLLKLNNKEIQTNENFVRYDKEFSLMKNLFMLKEPKIAKKITKTFDYENKNIITSCQLTKWSLQKRNINAFSTAETQNILTKGE